MKSAGIIVLILILLPAAAFSAGVRVNPEFFNSEALVQPAAEAVELTLQNGEQITGTITEENSQGIVFNIEGASINFSHLEIASRRKVQGAIPGTPADSKPFFIYDPRLNFFARLPFLPAKKEESKKAEIQASTLWGVKPQSLVVSESAGKVPLKGGVAGEYERIMSKESLEKWKNDSIAQLNANRNPMMEAFKYGGKGENAPSSDISKAEAKLRELEAQGS